VTRRRLVDAWLDNPPLDYIPVLAIAVGLGMIDPHRLVLDAARPTFYQTLAGVSGVLLSAGTITVTVFFAVAPTERLDRVVEVIGQRLRRLVMSSLSGLALTTGGFLGLFLLDYQTNRTRVVLASFLLVLMVLRFARLWWLLNAVLAVLAVRHTKGSATWERPTLKHGDYRVSRRGAKSRPSADD
jgi:hypothetical protein